MIDFAFNHHSEHKLWILLSCTLTYIYFLCITRPQSKAVNLSVIHSLSTYFAVSVISSGFIKLLSQLEGDLCVLEGALGADHHLVSLLADDYSWLSHITNLPGGKANT